MGVGAEVAFLGEGLWAGQRWGWAHGQSGRWERASGGHVCLLPHSFCICHLFIHLFNKYKHLLCARHQGDNDHCPQGAHNPVWELDVNQITLGNVCL